MSEFLCDLQTATKQAFFAPRAAVVRVVEKLDEGIPRPRIFLRPEQRHWHQANCCQIAEPTSKPIPETIIFQAPAKTVDEPAAVEKITPESLAYEILKLNPKNIPEQLQFKTEEAQAFKTIIDLMAKDKLAGKDGIFDKGDTAAIIKTMPWISRPIVARKLNRNEDLLPGKIDAEDRKLTIEELSDFEKAIEVIEKYTIRIGLQDKKKRFIPQSQEQWINFIAALMQSKPIPKTVSSRTLPVED